VAGPGAAAQTAPIDPATRIGAVELTASDLGRSRRFYEDVLGLRGSELADDRLALGAPDGDDALVVLRGDPAAPARSPRTTGLFHLAILVPNRVELARALARLAAHRWPLDGASDHLVSEALYLSDPDGNGIEIYRDLPRSDWHRRDGQIEMATLPLDLRSIGAELAEPAAPAQLVSPETRMGHIHLQVSDLETAEAFYCGVLGFDVTLRGYPGALFVSAGGYHHHIGLNTWHSRGAPPPPPGAVGLRHFEVVLPDDAALARVVDRVRGAPLATEPSVDGGVLVRDPFGNGVRLRTA
jgi:catechol 2,3-dioxygenase